MPFMNAIVGVRNVPGLRRATREALALYGVEFPSEVVVGRDVHFAHRIFGTVVHPNTSLGDECTIYHGVTLGRRNPHETGPLSIMGRLAIGRKAIICAGAVVLAGTEGLSVGEGTVVGANAVLLESTGDWEIWAGNPARRVGFRAPLTDAGVRRSSAFAGASRGDSSVPSRLDDMKRVN